MSFIFYDLVFLVLFVLFVFLFLRSRKKNLKKEGLLILYKAQWGIKIINYIGKKSPGTFKVLSYISVITGYILMVGIVYLIGRIVYVYATRPDIVQAIKVPPLIPLVPYLPEIFKLDFLPSFFFTYWIIIIAIIAITHEFAHGIFAAYNKVKIKTTGFGFFPYFLPIFLAAFVELDEDAMAKKKKFSQMAVLSAGTFANVLTAILFLAIMFLFFSTAFAPGGVTYDTYAYSLVPISAITGINNISLENPTQERLAELVNPSGSNEIFVGEEKFVGIRGFFNGGKNIAIYLDAPAINAGLESAILEVNGIKIKSVNNLQEELSKYSPGETITLNVVSKDEKDYNRDIVLGENPLDKNLPWLGIGFASQNPQGLSGKLYSIFSFKEPHIYYESKIGDLGLFIYDLLWWIILISLSVALVNMLPVGIFDGGRFFYLTVWGLTKNEKFAKKSFAFTTYFILGVFLLLMFLWAVAFI
jgi:membrane-associated protease RseP (regulator of RpoE activity)